MEGRNKREYNSESEESLLDEIIDKKNNNNAGLAGLISHDSRNKAKEGDMPKAQTVVNVLAVTLATIIAMVVVFPVNPVIVLTTMLAFLAALIALSLGLDVHKMLKVICNNTQGQNLSNLNDKNVIMFIVGLLSKIGVCAMVGVLFFYVFKLPIFAIGLSLAIACAVLLGLATLIDYKGKFGDISSSVELKKTPSHFVISGASTAPFRMSALKRAIQAGQPIYRPMELPTLSESSASNNSTDSSSRPSCSSTAS
jgi:hypothetical protein